MARLSYIVMCINIVLMCVLAEELYSDKFDDIEIIDNVLSNDALRNEYYNCFMDTGPCETDALKYFREIIAEVLQTNCKKCTEKQKQNVKIGSEWFKKNKPGQWKALVVKLKDEQ